MPDNLKKLSKLDEQNQSCQLCQWENPKPLPKVSYETPVLKPEMMPSPLKEWLVDVAERMSVPLEFVYIPALTMMSSLIGTQLYVYPKKYDDWKVVPNLWGSIVANPGWKKSPAISEVLKPLNRFREEAFKEFKEAEEAHKKHIDLLDGKIKKIDKKIEKLRAQKNGSKDKEIAQLEKDRELVEKDLAKLKKAVCRRYIVNDGTVEKISELAKDNPIGILVNRDELSGLISSMNKSGREGSKEFYLEAWNGNGSFTSDTIGRGTVHVPLLCLSVFGGIQPQKLEKLILDPLRKGHGDDGFLQRFQLLVWPDKMPDYMAVDRVPDKKSQECTYQILSELKNLSADYIGEENGLFSPCKPFVKFSKKAQNVFDDFLARNEKKVRSPELVSFPSFASHISKYNSLMPSLALIFHLIDFLSCEDKKTIGEISEKSAKLACDWCDYLERHSAKLYEFELRPEYKPAHAMAAKIKEGSIYDGMPRREIYRKGWKNLGSSDLADLAIQKLCECGWVQLETLKDKGGSSQVLRINPSLLKDNNLLLTQLTA